MSITAKLLKDITAEARPIIERQLHDAKLIAGLRDVVAANGGDWGALKALIKAHIEDENDEAGDSKRVQKILDKADSSTAYADMLGLAKMNEKNFSANEYAAAKSAANAGSSNGRIAEFDSADTGSNPVLATKSEPFGAATSSDRHEADESPVAHSPLADLPQPSAPEEASPPAQSSGAAPFINPRCLHSDTCHFAGSKDACHGCLMAWAQRPKDEQRRLWAEANEPARVVA